MNRGQRALRAVLEEQKKTNHKFRTAAEDMLEKLIAAAPSSPDPVETASQLHDFIDAFKADVDALSAAILRAKERCHYG